MERNETLEPDPVEYCPACGEKLSHEPEGNRVYECPNHGEIITNFVNCEDA